jgi:hypothetical protein
MKCLLSHRCHTNKLINTSVKKFSYIYHNFPIVSQYYCNGKLIQLDSGLESYNKYITALLQKRWTLKQDIPALVKTIHSKKAFAKWLLLQKLDRKYTQLPEEMLRFQYDNGFINRNYIFNILFEKNEIDLYKTIADKLIMNGYTCNYDDFNDYMGTRDKVARLVNIFYNGEVLTDLENVLETIYIKEKRNKYLDTPKFLMKGSNFMYTEGDYKKYMTTFGTLAELKDKLSIEMENKYINKKLDWGLLLETVQMMGYSNRTL